MKLMLASDIHGSAFYCSELIKRFEIEKPQKLVLLGDILYHGPRNALPKEYNPKAVAEMLNSISESIICVRGNCDSEVDSMVLDFPVQSDTAALFFDGRTIYCTHGHIYSKQNPLPMHPGDIMASGHTHVPMFSTEKGITFINPGSVSIPKEESLHGYIIIEDGTAVWKDMSGQSYMEKRLNV